MAHLDKGRSLFNFGMRLMVANDVVRARKRIRNAWIAGFVLAGLGFINALIFFSGADSTDQGSWSTGQLVFVTAESSLMVVLSYGVLKRMRASAILLLLYFLISRIPLLALGVMRFEVLPIQLLVGYLFFQGLRGALTFHQLTQPGHLITSLPDDAISGINEKS
jgi:hypothetical protein